VEGASLALTPENSEVLGQMCIDRSHHPFLGQARTGILNAGNLANSMHAGICPTGQDDLHLPTVQPGERGLQILLDASAIKLPL
jgi:hypothetical protein